MKELNCSVCGRKVGYSNYTISNMVFCSMSCGEIFNE